MNVPRNQDWPEGRKWFVLRTKSRHEMSIERMLSARSIPCYLPVCRKNRAWSDRMKRVTFPLFPGYIFVCSDFQNLPNLSFIPGSSGLVRFENRLAVVPETEIDRIRILEASDFEIDVHAEIIPGDPVEVVSGPLKGLQGNLASIKNVDRLIINAYILNQSVSVEISRRDVQPLKTDRNGG